MQQNLKIITYLINFKTKLESFLSDRITDSLAITICYTNGVALLVFPTSTLPSRRQTGGRAGATGRAGGAKRDAPPIYIYEARNGFRDVYFR